MAYSIYVKSITGKTYLFNMSLGSASYIGHFWVNNCDEDFELIPNLLSMADTDSFIITPSLYSVFLDDLEKLENKWRNKFIYDEDKGALDALLKKSQVFKEAIDIAKEFNLDVKVC